MQSAAERHAGRARRAAGFTLIAITGLAAHDAPVRAQSMPAQAAPDAAVVRFDFDPSHTHLGFAVRHMMVTNVRGRFNDFDGHVMFNTADPARSVVKLTVRTASVDTEHERRDTDLRSDRFFDVEKFPTLTFESTRVERSGERWLVTGQLTIKETTREVQIPFEVLGPHDTGNGQQILGAEGSLRIDRQDYGLTWNRAIETGVLVGDDVRIEIAVEARTPRPGL